RGTGDIAAPRDPDWTPSASAEFAPSREYRSRGRRSAGSPRGYVVLLALRARLFERQVLASHLPLAPPLRTRRGRGCSAQSFTKAHAQSTCRAIRQRAPAFPRPRRRACFAV